MIYLLLRNETNNTYKLRRLRQYIYGWSWNGGWKKRFGNSFVGWTRSAITERQYNAIVKLEKIGIMSYDKLNFALIISSPVVRRRRRTIRW